MSVFGPSHPLDVDLADLVDGMLDAFRSAQVEAHLVGCPPCRARQQRLVEAPPGGLIGDRPLPVPTFEPLIGDAGGGGGAAPGELWLAAPEGDTGADQRVLVLVRGIEGDQAVVAPVTFDVEAADDETLVIDAGRSPLSAPLAIHPRLAAGVPVSVLVTRMSVIGSLDGAASGPPIVDATDPRLEVRQCLADAMAALAGGAPEPVAGRLDQIRSSLIADLRFLRGDTCLARPLFDWGDALIAHRAGWEPIAIVDEVGVVLVVLDTPHGLTDDADFHAARSVLTRFNGTALVVLASAVGDLADVFDASSLNHGIDAPSGRHTPPRPLISDLAPYDAVAKFLDRTTGARAAAPAARGPVTRVDVGDILREAAGTALADAARQAPRFKIVPKRRGYESVADAQERLESALARAFGPESVVEGLLQPDASAEAERPEPPADPDGE